jgi:hypothetical protein
MRRRKQRRSERTSLVRCCSLCKRRSLWEVNVYENSDATHLVQQVRFAEFCVYSFGYVSFRNIPKSVRCGVVGVNPFEPLSCHFSLPELLHLGRCYGYKNTRKKRERRKTALMIIPQILCITYMQHSSN